MTWKQLVVKRAYVIRAVLYKICRLPGAWRLLGKKWIPRVKGADGKRLSFEEAAADAIGTYEKGSDEKKKTQLKKDMVKAWYKNLATPEEYFIFGFQDLSQKQRDAFVSRKEKDLQMALHVGLGDGYLLLKDKYRFYSHFKEFFHRDVCRLTDREEDREQFLSFCRSHSRYIAKNNKGRMGIGTMVRSHDGTEGSIAEEMKFLLAQGQEWMIEELIRQDERMAVLNPSSVNTLRICSRWNSEGFSVFEAFIRMGRAGSEIDNVSSGGIAAAVNMETGTVVSQGFGKGNALYPAHPDSNVTLIGFTVPEWDALMLEVRKIHSLIKDYPYVGWDFALSTKGWVVVEGNWGNFLTQYLKIGIREEFLKCFL